MGDVRGAFGLAAESLNHYACWIAGGGIGKAFGGGAERRLAVIGDFIPMPKGGVAVEEAVGGVGGAIGGRAEARTVLGDDAEI